MLQILVFHMLFIVLYLSLILNKICLNLILSLRVDQCKQTVTKSPYKNGRASIKIKGI